LKEETRAKRQEKVCGFFHPCRDLGWIDKSPMAGIDAIKLPQSATGYFTPEESERFFKTIDTWNDARWPERERVRLKALTELMRWSGLAIGDASTLKRDRLLDDDSIFLYRGKTGHPVRVLWPPSIAAALCNVPTGKDTGPAYFFWSGNGLKKSTVADWQRVYRRVFKKAGMFTDASTGEAKRAHPHMFRDTFAIETLNSGAPIEQVSMLLGHKNIKTTQDSYLPWVKSRQVLLDATMRNSWGGLQNSIQDIPDPMSTGKSA
jgi:site-specific recombinase XerD